jgi:hypothetical protein
MGRIPDSRSDLSADSLEQIASRIKCGGVIPGSGMDRFSSTPFAGCRVQFAHILAIDISTILLRSATITQLEHSKLASASPLQPEADVFESAGIILHPLRGFPVPVSFQIFLVTGCMNDFFHCSPQYFIMFEQVVVWRDIVGCPKDCVRSAASK